MFDLRIVWIVSPQLREVVSLKMTCPGSPSQWEGRLSDNSPLYIRYRWGHLTVEIGKPGEGMNEAVLGERIYGGVVGDDLDGDMSTEEMIGKVKNLDFSKLKKTNDSH